MLEAEVVGGDHADEDDGEGQDAAGHLEVEAQGRQRGAGPAGGPQAEAEAQGGRHGALEEGDEERGVEAQRRAVQQVLVEEHHGDGDEPVQADHQGDAQGPQHEGRPPAPGTLRRQQRVGSTAQRHPQDPGPRQLRSAHGGRGPSGRQPGPPGPAPPPASSRRPPRSPAAPTAASTAAGPALPRAPRPRPPRFIHAPRAPLAASPACRPRRHRGSAPAASFLPARRGRGERRAGPHRGEWRRPGGEPCVRPSNPLQPDGAGRPAPGTSAGRRRSLPVQPVAVLRWILLFLFKTAASQFLCSSRF